MDIAGEESFTVHSGIEEVDVASKVGTELYNIVIGLTSSGGRVYFAEDVKQNINRVDQCTRAG
jgi:hypothetical protein